MHPEECEAALVDSLADLGLDYVDLYLVHWPIAFRRGPDDFPVRPDGSMVFDESVDPADSYAALERLVEKGLARDIGVANHNQKQVEDIIKRTKVRRMIFTDRPNKRLVSDQACHRAGGVPRLHAAEAPALLPAVPGHLPNGVLPARVRRSPGAAEEPGRPSLAAAGAGDRGHRREARQDAGAGHTQVDGELYGLNQVVVNRIELSNLCSLTQKT